MTQRHSRLLALIVMSLGAFAFYGCAEDTLPPSKVPVSDFTYNGPTTHIYGGDVHTWIRVHYGSADTNVVAMGITMSEAFMQGLDRKTASMNPLALPSLAQKLTPFDHVSLDWNPEGHPPPGIYDVPHFDFHFYTVTTNEQMLIGNDSAAMVIRPDSSLVPQYYTPSGTGVPMMGWHWFDSRSPEYHGERFTKTLVYGFNRGHLVFVEPMITEATLLAKPKDTLSIPQPARWEHQGVRNPTKYAITYDAENKTYVITYLAWVKPL